jgi:CheY-like chemotaxis protein
MSRARILIVEDDRITAEDIRLSLGSLGYSVTGMASSGEEAIKKAEELHPDLVLMDIVLRGDMDGIEAAGRIRARFNIPVVYLTAYADDETLERAKLTQPFGYILKPFDDRELRSNIEMALYRCCCVERT